MQERAEASIWDRIVIPNYVKDANLFHWLAATMPDPLAHDFVISTDGSGAVDGVGASAAIIQRIDYVDQQRRACVQEEIWFCGNFGESVQRNELQALVAGVRIACQIALGTGKLDTIKSMVGEDRLRILWYTDRRNLACSFLFRENGDLMTRRNTDRDLWMQWSYFAPHVCLTPICLPRNEERNQSRCDTICTTVRRMIKSAAKVVHLVLDMPMGEKSQKGIK